MQQRYTNDVYVGGSNGVLTVCVSGLASLTNSIDVASWSVDSDTSIQMDPDNPGPGNYIFAMLGNGYPAIEATYYSRYQGDKGLFRRRVDSFVSRDVDAGGGLAAIDLESWYRCYTTTTYASASVWDTSITPPSGESVSSLYYFTSWSDSAN